jgi:hypothetical protein
VSLMFSVLLYAQFQGGDTVETTELWCTRSMGNVCGAQLLRQWL